MKKLSRIINFKKNSLGFFIHYGPYSFMQSGEWYAKMNDISMEKYYEQINLKNKTFDIDFDEIIHFMKLQGFKYAIFTSKHHDGFCMYDSKGMSILDVNLTKNKKDLTKEFIKSCIKYDIEPILYHATLDWSKTEFSDDFDEYLSYLHKSIDFLCKTYKGIKGFWFDGNWSKPNSDWKLDRLYGTIRKHIPEAIIINNSGMEDVGVEQHSMVDSITFEQGLVKKIDYSIFSRDLFAEVCESFNDHWGSTLLDFNVKSPKDLILKFMESKKYEANYVINISIGPDGSMSNYEKETLKIFSSWLKKFGEEFYEEFKVISISGDDFVVEVDDQLYFYLYGIYSGGHVKKIQDGGGVQPSRVFEFNKNIKLKNFNYVDNNSPVVFKVNKNKITITPNSFDYGKNTIIRLAKGKRD